MPLTAIMESGMVFPNPNQSPCQRCVMSSELKIEANRQNAQHSTGPSTPEGRAAVRLNGLKHGLCAETIVVPGEDPAEFEAMRSEEHTSELQSRENLVCRLLLEKKK